MPFIQCDLEVGLSDVLREHPASNIGEAGGPGRALISKRNQGRRS
jgi:hypothetical protein